MCVSVTAKEGGRWPAGGAGRRRNLHSSSLIKCEKESRETLHSSFCFLF